MFCKSTTCSLCTICFLKCDSSVAGGHKAENCHYLKSIKAGGKRMSEIDQNALYEGTCPICCTDEMYDRKLQPNSVKHSPLG